jgi:hypothetical protein
LELGALPGCHLNCPTGRGVPRCSAQTAPTSPPLCRHLDHHCCRPTSRPEFSCRFEDHMACRSITGVGE